MSSELTLEQLRERYLKIPASSVSDALDAFGIMNNTVTKIHPVWDCPPVFGRAVTVRNVPAATHAQKHHGGFVTAQHVKPGDIIVVDNGGDEENNGWGEVVSWAVHLKGAVATLVDGAVRDVMSYKEMGYPVYAKAITLRTARNRMIQDAININIRFGSTQVRPGDYVMADINGVCIIPPEKVEEILGMAEEIERKEQAMIEKMKQGINPLEAQSGYETMLNAK
jgi:regulator of RNase E activity RraA